MADINELTQRVGSLEADMGIVKVNVERIRHDNAEFRGSCNEHRKLLERMQATQQKEHDMRIEMAVRLEEMKEIKDELRDVASVLRPMGLLAKGLFGSKKKIAGVSALLLGIVSTISSLIGIALSYFGL